MLRPLSLSRLFLYVITLLISAGVWHAAWAQQPQSNTLKELEKIGESLVDDRVDMYDRYVFFDDQTVDQDVSLGLPVMSNQDIQEWLIDTVADAMTVTPTQYPMHIRKIHRYFTTEGWRQFMGQWQQAQIEELVLNRHYTMTALVIKLPTILAKGRDKGVYRWIADVPVLLSYVQNTGETQSYETVLRLDVTRIPMQQDARLVAIDGWSLAPRDPPRDDKREDAKTR